MPQRCARCGDKQSGFQPIFGTATVTQAISLQVQDILALHIVPEYYEAEDLLMMDGDNITTLGGEDIMVMLEEDDATQYVVLMSGNTSARVTDADIGACSETQVRLRCVSV